MTWRSPPPPRLTLCPRSTVLRRLEGELQRTARRLERLDPRPSAYVDEGLRPVLRLLGRRDDAGGGGSRPA
jgi:hypothetical protein